MSWWFFLIPVMSAFSTWLVIKIFFTILFHPVLPRSILGIKMQGIFPARQSSIAIQTGRFVAEEFLSMDMIEKKINDPSNLEKIMPVIGEHIEDFLRNKLKKEMPVVGMLIGDKTIHSLKKVFMNELEILFPKIIGGFVSNVVTDLNIEETVAQKITSLSITEMEKAFYKKFSKEVRLAQIIALSIGLFIGLLTMVTVFYIQ